VTFNPGDRVSLIDAGPVNEAKEQDLLGMLGLLPDYYNGQLGTIAEPESTFDPDYTYVLLDGHTDPTGFYPEELELVEAAQAA
jgi:hypothetical protein